MKNLFTRLSLTLIFFFIVNLAAFAQPVANFSSNITHDCSPAQIVFTDNSTGVPSGTTYNWDFGDLGTSTISAPSHTYNNPGTYTVTLTVSNSSGTDSETKTNYITVFRNPVASFSISEDTVCSTSPIGFQSTSLIGDAPIDGYSWTFNDGSATVTGVSNLNHQFVFSGSTVKAFYPSLNIIDTNGCNSGFSDTVYVFPVPIVSFTPTPAGSCTAPATISFTNNTLNTNQYSWTFGDTASGGSNVSAQANPSHTYNTTGTYTVVLTAGVQGCSASQTSVITVAQAVADFSASDTMICYGDTVYFTNTGSTGSYFWNFGDVSSGVDNTSTLQDPFHLFATTGIHTVQLNLVVGSCVQLVSKTIIVRPAPVPVITAPVIQSCDTSFTVSFSDASTSNLSWSWNFGDAASGTQNTSTLQNPTHTYNSFGLYTVSLLVTDSFGCQGFAVRNSYIQIIQPVIDFIQEDSGCVGSTFPFNLTMFSPADPNIANVSWYFEDTTAAISSGANPFISHTFNTVGIWDVTATVTTVSGCTATLTKQDFIRIGTPPATNFSATPLVICFDENVDFTDLTPNPVTGWQWDFGDGQGSTSQNPTHQFKYDTSGVADPFDIILISFYNGCPDTLQIADMITVKGPIPNFSIQYNCPSPYFVGFTNLSGGATSYLWDFGDGTPTSTLTDPSHTYAGRGTYDVVLYDTSTVSGCGVDTTYRVYVTDPVAAIAVSDSVVCRPGVINFTGSGSTDANQQIWYFGEGIPLVRDTSLWSDTLHLYNNTGYYNVQYTIEDIHQCRDSAYKLVHIIGPTAGFTATPFTGCAPILSTFRDTSLTEGGAVSQWVWNYGSVSRTITTPPGTDTMTYSVPGVYTVSLTVTDVNGCTHSTTATNYINPTKPLPVILQPDTSCRNQQQTFVVNPGAFVASPVTYVWDFGDGNSTTVNSPSVNHAYPNNGSYPLSVIVTDNNGCVDSTTSNIFIYTTPATFSTTVNDTCINSNGLKQAQIEVINTMNDNSYITRSPSYYFWDFTATAILDSTTRTLSSATYNFVTAGTYDLSLIVKNDFGCMDTLIKPSFVVLNGPTGTVSLSPDSGCRPLTVNFTGSATNINYYAWDFGDGNVIPNTQDSTVTHTYTNNGIFKPHLYVAYLFDTLNNEVCLIQIASADTIVKVTSLVSVDIVETSILVTDGERDTLHVLVANPGGQPLTYNWTPAAFVNQDPVVQNTFYATTSGGDQYYYVEVAYGVTGCSGVDSVLVLYKPCEGVLKIPNVFTPDNDAKNDTYHIEDMCNFEDFRFIIYNRWGKVIFESTDADFHWDGKTTGGTEASEGVYYYVLNAKSGTFNGYIQLIRE